MLFNLNERSEQSGPPAKKLGLVWASVAFFSLGLFWFLSFPAV